MYISTHVLFIDLTRISTNTGDFPSVLECGIYSVYQLYVKEIIHQSFQQNKIRIYQTNTTD